MKKLLMMFSTLLVLTACGGNDDTPVTKDAAQSTEVETAYDTIEIDKVMDYVDDGYTVVDVREIDEYESGHIPKAVNAPLSELENDEFTPLEEDEKYIIICQSGNRSVTASNILYDKGYNILNVSEGMSSWTGNIEN